MNEEILAKARTARSPDELFKMAKDSGFDGFTEENARGYFDLLHQSGEIADEELANAAGGCTDYYPDTKKRSVTPGNLCGLRNEDDRLWVCRNCGRIAALCNCYPHQTDLEDLFGAVTRPTSSTAGPASFIKSAPTRRSITATATR